MASTSTIALVRTQLVTLIAAALPGVKVSRRLPPLAEEAHEQVWLDRRVAGAQEIETIRAVRKHREETYVVPVLISILNQEQAEPDVVETRAMAILAAIEDVLADDPKLGFSPKVIEWAKAGAFELVSDASAEPAGWLVEVRLEVNVYAHLT